MSEGWISLHRRITEHWIWDDPTKLKWWLDILISANHSGKKVAIGNTLIECNRGQSAKSLQSWARRWMVSKDTVRNFFKLLSNDGMVVLENLQKTTRITVCNYDEYQANLHDYRPQSKRKEIKEDRQENLIYDEDMVNNLYDLYPSKCVVKNSSTGKGMKNKETIKRLLKTMPYEKLEATIVWYVTECRKNGTYMKNFSTFLNNLPEIPEENPLPIKSINKPDRNILQ